MGALEKVEAITILEKQVWVAKNGGYKLVKQDGEDAFETPIYRVVGPEEFSDRVFDALIQIIGQLLTERQASRDNRRASLEGGS